MKDRNSPTPPASIAESHRGARVSRHFSILSEPEDIPCLADAIIAATNLGLLIGAADYLVADSPRVGSDGQRMLGLDQAAAIVSAAVQAAEKLTLQLEALQKMENAK